MDDNFKHTALTNKIIRCFYTVYNQLGFGFLEKVYEKSLLIELRKEGLSATRQTQLKVFYNQIEVGDYFADIIVENEVIIEVKTAEGLIEIHEAQLINYLKATNIEVGLLLNFGKTPQFKRKVFSNKYKKHL
ncbi:GxxExxY protein [Sediminibacterium sp. KACHI17]|uniref:GxxExxY protein n=1 Tax=Sediminibacterium sp. KACHI17 TaxID=1751071 RepID=A0AAT9GGJ8_9BACT